MINKCGFHLLSTVHYNEFNYSANEAMLQSCYIIDKNRANLPSLSFEGDLILPPETILQKRVFCSYEALGNVTAAKPFFPEIEFNDIRPPSAPRPPVDGPSLPSMCSTADVTRVIKSRLRKHIPGT